MAISDWSAATLCTDTDVEGKETNVQKYAKREGWLAKWRDEAKQEIAHRLRHALRAQALSVDPTDILDLIESYVPLKEAAIFLTLHLLFNDLTTNSADIFMQKAVHYQDKWESEFPRAVAMLSLDIDESGTITSGEELNVSLGIRMSR